MYPVVILVLAVGCDFTGKHNAKQQVESSINIDSPVESTGNAQLDSLLLAAATAQEDTTLAKLYFQIGEMYLENDAQQAKEYYLKLRTLSDKLNWNEGRYLFALGYTDILNWEGLMDSSIVIHQQALELAKQEMNERQVATISANIGNCYNYKKWFETALQYYRDALTIFEKRGDKFRLAHLYYLMGVVYNDMNMQDENLMYCEKAVNILNEKPDTLPRAHALINYAVALNEGRQLEKAENCLLEAQRICMLHNSKYSLTSIFSNLGNIALQKYELDKVDMYANKSLEIALEFGDVAGYCISNRALGYVQEYQGNFNKSEEYAKEALETANEFDLPVEKMKSHRLLADLSTARHNFRSYRYYGAKADSIETAIISELTVRTVMEMEAKYETAKKEFEIERQRHIIDRQNMQRGLLVAGVAVCAVILALLWYMLRLRTRRNHALAEMNATKDKFFSIISHDLKNPALAQRDALQLLIKNARSWDADALMEYYHELLKSVEGQVELLYNLLNWAQIQTERMAYMPVQLNLATCLRPEISLIRKMAENKGIKFIVEMPEDVLVTGDSNMLATIVRNLLTNAVKFTGKGDTVTLNVAQSRDVARNVFTVSVTDTGTGMSKEQVETLLATSPPTNSHQGTAGEQGSGLGLIVCKELLEKHGSVLHIESEEGKGSHFWFTI